MTIKGVIVVNIAIRVEVLSENSTQLQEEKVEVEIYKTCDNYFK